MDVAELGAPLGTPLRPRWRGRLHLSALVAGTPLLVALVLRADGARARAGVIVYAVGLCAMFAVSTTYHRWVHGLRARRIWNRADHATIYAAITGTFTPVCLLSMSTRPAIVLLVTFWVLAAIGAVMKIGGWRLADRIATGLYIAIGWAGAVLVPALWRTAGAVPVALLFVGGALYTIGAITFAAKWPKLRPSVFSYHEVWHAFTIAGAGAHFAVVWLIAT